MASDTCVSFQSTFLHVSSLYFKCKGRKRTNTNLQKSDGTQKTAMTCASSRWSVPNSLKKTISTVVSQSCNTRTSYNIKCQSIYGSVR